MSYLMKTFNEQCQLNKADCGKGHFCSEIVEEKKDLIKLKCRKVLWYGECGRTFWIKKRKYMKERKRTRYD